MTVRVFQQENTTKLRQHHASDTPSVKRWRRVTDEWNGYMERSYRKGEKKGKWCVAKYGDPYSEFVLCI